MSFSTFPSSFRPTFARAVAGACMVAAAALTLVTPAHATDKLVSSYLKCRSTSLTTFKGSIVDAAIATPELSTLTSLVVAANLTGALSGPGPLTVFAPTNAAFAKVPGALLDLLGADSALLTQVLTYHVVAGTVDPRRNLIPYEVKTLQGQSVFLAYDRDGASVNQSTAACAGVKTDNGTVWIIDSVLLPQFK